MELSDEQRTFLEQNRSAAMVTLRRDGSPHAVRVGIALIDGKVWSSGAPDRVRTRFLRRDPRCTVFVVGSGYGYLTMEGRVTILDGPDAPDRSVRLFQTMQAAMQPAPPPTRLPAPTDPPWPSTMACTRAVRCGLRSGLRSNPAKPPV